MCSLHSCRLRIPKESGLAPKNQSHRVGFQEGFKVPVPGHLQGHLPARPPHSPCSEQSPTVATQRAAYSPKCCVGRPAWSSQPPLGLAEGLESAGLAGGGSNHPES